MTKSKVVQRGMPIALRRNAVEADNPVILEDGHEETLREKEAVRKKKLLGRRKLLKALPVYVDVSPTDKGNHKDLNDSLPCTPPIFNSLDQNENEGTEVSLIEKSNNHGVEVKFNDPTAQTEEQENQVMQYANKELIVENQVMQQIGGKLLVEDHLGYQIPVVNEADQGSIPYITDVDILPPIATAKVNMHAKEANLSKFAQTSYGPFEVQHLMQRLKYIEEDIQEIEDRFGTRMVHNFRLVEDRLAAVERHISDHGSDIKRAISQMKVQLMGWKGTPSIEHPTSKDNDN
ncbi:hypothetical protein Sjap_008098 [Stephania japonica]|uniref:Uncharacterized protein n=1 Tax=Stephania japonica TaxID=461633 RepID=A0AAP0JP96_9MAGN